MQGGKAMHISGIDPGLTGAVAILPEGLFFDTPTASVKKGSSKKVYLVAEMASFIRSFGDSSDPHSHVYIEDVHAMPGQGVSSTFNFGRGLGLWEGIVAALGIPYTMVTPQAWKKEMMSGMGGKDKGASCVRAGQLFPLLAEQLTREKARGRGLVFLHGRADALLIAEYGRRQQGDAAR